MSILLWSLVMTVVLPLLLWAAGASAGQAWVETDKLEPLDPTSSGSFGHVVSQSGNVAVIGDLYDDEATTDAGAVFIFESAGAANWTQKTKLFAADAASGDLFGEDVAIDGNVAIVGAGYAGSLNTGAAYIFTVSDGEWSQSAKLTASDAASYDFFGNSVSISGDWAIVGVDGADVGLSNTGAAYIFTLSSGSWSQVAKLSASDATAEAQFGWSVSISDDVALIGAKYDDAAGTNSGAAYIFTRTESGWTQTNKKSPYDGAAYDYFGVSVCVNGGTAIVGNYGDDDAGENAGSAIIYTLSDDEWTRTVKLIASDAAAYDNFGVSVSIADDLAIVGSYGDDDSGDLAGSAYCFVLSDTGDWTQTAKLVATDTAAGDRFGYAVSISPNFALVGATGNGVGSVYTFNRSATTAPSSAPTAAPSAAPTATFSPSVAPSMVPTLASSAPSPAPTMAPTATPVSISSSFVGTLFGIGAAMVTVFSCAYCFETKWWSRCSDCCRRGDKLDWNTVVRKCKESQKVIWISLGTVGALGPRVFILMTGDPDDREYWTSMVTVAASGFTIVLTVLAVWITLYEHRIFGVVQIFGMAMVPVSSNVALLLGYCQSTTIKAHTTRTEFFTALVTSLVWCVGTALFMVAVIVDEEDEAQLTVFSFHGAVHESAGSGSVPPPVEPSSNCNENGGGAGDGNVREEEADAAKSVTSAVSVPSDSTSPDQRDLELQVRDAPVQDLRGECKSQGRRITQQGQELESDSVRLLGTSSMSIQYSDTSNAASAGETSPEQSNSSPSDGILFRYKAVAYFTLLLTAVPLVPDVIIVDTRNTDNRQYWASLYSLIAGGGVLLGNLIAICATPCARRFRGVVQVWGLSLIPTSSNVILIMGCYGSSTIRSETSLFYLIWAFITTAFVGFGALLWMVFILCGDEKEVDRVVFDYLRTVESQQNHNSEGGMEAAA